LNRGYYWVLDPGKCFAHNASLYNLFPETWFVYMKACESRESSVQVVFFVPHESFPEIQDHERRRREFWMRNPDSFGSVRSK
jgi:hypothetical protein